MRRGVMQGYEPLSLGQAPIPAPPGTSFPTGFPLEALAQVAQFLNLQSVGLYTPWAGRAGGVDWIEVRQPPDTNIGVFALNDQAVLMVPQATFGQQLPFVAILSDRLATPSGVEAAWEGTAYKAYDTQAVYRQDDPLPTPKISFLHWGELRGPGDGRGNKSLEAAAAMAGGKLVFAQQVDYNSTATRKPPPVPFEQALAVQLGLAKSHGPLPTAPPVGPAIGPAKPSPVVPIVPIAVAAGAAALVYYLVRKSQQKRGVR